MMAAVTGALAPAWPKPLRIRSNIKYDVCAEFTLERLLRYLEKLGIKYEFRRVA